MAPRKKCVKGYSSGLSISQSHPLAKLATCVSLAHVVQQDMDFCHFHLCLSATERPLRCSGGRCAKYWVLPHPAHRLKHLLCVTSNPHSSPVRQVLYFPHFSQMGTLRHREVTQLFSDVKSSERRNQDLNPGGLNAEHTLLTAVLLLAHLVVSPVRRPPGLNPRYLTRSQLHFLFDS